MKRKNHGLVIVPPVTPPEQCFTRLEPELAAQEEARKKAEAREKLPETVAALQEDSKTLKKENEMLKQCLLEMSEIVYA